MKRKGFNIRPIQDPWVMERVKGSPDELLKDLQLLLNDERQLAGADAYRYVLRRIIWTYPIYLLSIVPGLHGLFNQAYRAFANNRHKISRACKLD